jgi:hypothetical protein
MKHGKHCFYCRDFCHVPFYRQQHSHALEGTPDQRFTFVQQAKHRSGQYWQCGLLDLRPQLAYRANLPVAFLLHSDQHHHAGAVDSAQLQTEIWLGFEAVEREVA